MKIGAIIIFVAPIVIANMFDIGTGWKAGIFAVSLIHYMGLTGAFGPISMYRASKEIEFEEQNKPRIEPYF